VDTRERHIVGLYTGESFYDNLNKFLSKRDTLESYRDKSMMIYYTNFYHYLTGSNSRNINQSDTHNNNTETKSRLQAYWPHSTLDWFQKLFHHFTMELYHIIKRCPIYEKKLTVYRGVRFHYLKEDPSHIYHITTFLSTSLDINVAIEFSPLITYVFTVVPGVQSIYIGGYKGDNLINPFGEDELLINPYVLYTFIKKEIIGGRTEYHYLLFSGGSPVQPPASFDSFMEFRDTIAEEYDPMRGGSETNYVPYRRNNNLIRNSKSWNNRRNRKANHNTANRMSTTRRMRNTKNGNTKNGNTKRANTKRVNRKGNTSSNSALNRYRERMTSFIGTSSKGMPITREIKEMVQAAREGMERGE
jgi:hypothetical protein